MSKGIGLFAASMLALALSATQAAAQKKYDPGASDSEIKVGQTVPFSGPASAYASIGKAQLAYFRMLNEQGGINGAIRMAWARFRHRKAIGKPGG